jgi:hypothetical protein
MGDGYNFAALKAEILRHSKATDWATARREWALVNIHRSEENETCLCQHYPIREICVIKNGLTGHVTEVGNVCVKRFLGIRSDRLFSAVRRIQKDITKSLNEDAIAFFHQCGVINSWEYEFLQNTQKKRGLTVKQMNVRQGINRQVLEIIARRGLKGYTSYEPPLPFQWAADAQDQERLFMKPDLPHP